MDLFPFKDLSIKQIEGAVAAAVQSLTNTETRVELFNVEHVSDGADVLIGQQRYRIVLTVMTGRASERRDDDVPKH